MCRVTPCQCCTPRRLFLVLCLTHCAASSLVEAASDALSSSKGVCTDSSQPGVIFSIESGNVESRHVVQDAERVSLTHLATLSVPGDTILCAAPSRSRPGVLWAAGSSGALHVINTTDPATLAVVSDVPGKPVPGCSALEQHEHVVYVCGGAGVTAYDTAGSAHAVVLQQACSALAVDDDRQLLYVAAGSELLLLNISTPMAPQALRTAYLPGRLLNLVLSEARLLAAADTRLFVLNPDPESQAFLQLTTFPTQGVDVFDMTVAGQLAYVADRTHDQVVVLSLRDSDQRDVYSLPYRGVRELHYADGYLFVASLNGLYVYTDGSFQNASHTTEPASHVRTDAEAQLLSRIQRMQNHAAGAAVASALVSAGTAGPLRLMLASQWCEHSSVGPVERHLQQVVHPTQWVLFGSEFVGVVIGNACLVAGVAAACLVVCAAVSCTSSCGDISGVAAARFPSLPLLLFQLLYPGLALGALTLMLEAASWGSFCLGLGVAALCVLVPTAIVMRVCADVPRLAGFRNYQSITGLTRTLVGRGDWVNRSPCFWTWRYGSISRCYHEDTVWYSGADFAVLLLIAVIEAVPTETTTHCGHVHLAAGCVFLASAILSLVLWPHARPRDAVVDVLSSVMMGLALLLMSMGYYHGNIGYWTLELGTTVLLMTTGVFVVKGLMDLVSQLCLCCLGDVFGPDEVDLDDALTETVNPLSPSFVPHSYIASPCSDTLAPSEFPTPKTFSNPTPRAHDLLWKNSSALPLLSASWSAPPALKSTSTLLTPLADNLRSSRDSGSRSSSMTSSSSSRVPHPHLTPLTLTVSVLLTDGPPSGVIEL